VRAALLPSSFHTGHGLIAGGHLYAERMQSGRSPRCLQWTREMAARKVDEIDPDLAKMLADKGLMLCGVYQAGLLKEYMAELDKADKDGSKEG
jgi:hypothetical protein